MAGDENLMPSIGFPFENPLEGYDSGEPASQDTLTELYDVLQLSPSIPQTQAQLQTATGESVDTSFDSYMLPDGFIAVSSTYIAEQTFITFQEFVVGFAIVKPGTEGRIAYYFDVIMDPSPAVGLSHVEDRGVGELLTLGAHDEMAASMVELAIDLDADSAPDTVAGIDDEPEEKGNGADYGPLVDMQLARVDQDLAAGDTLYEAGEFLGADKPLRTFPLTEPLARKVFQVVRPVIIIRALGARR